jgi:hypothetical protein
MRSICPNHKALFIPGTLIIFVDCINVYMVSNRLHELGSHTSVIDYMSLALLIVHYLFGEKWCSYCHFDL